MAAPKDLPDVGGFIRDLRRNAKISLRQLAEQAGVSNPYLSQIERGLRKPSAEVLQQLASALRVSTPAMYLRAGLLDDKEGQGVLAAIAIDPDLTMAQKQSLSQIYETFRRENTRLTEATAGRPTPPEPTTDEALATSEPAVTDEPAVTERPVADQVGTDQPVITDQPVVTDRTAASADRPNAGTGPTAPAPSVPAPSVPTEAAATVASAATGPVTPEGTPTEAVLESVAVTEAGTAPAPATGGAATRTATGEARTAPATGTRDSLADAASTTSNSKAAGAAEEELS
ncbi:Helix-turn-helix [Micromonospora matsumotoense]|uniref:Helix-turn-helix n=1 Tax=Micromonospora matsumotoense TaxID=121616 RepID=A0A1C4WR50_9ACTN|nr:helix-turn-helix transcriptional regulator [Micromonospora matsumotoense]SCE98766.1 Helix-turn-helix [Micromonospora matsumotoense]